jgi:hypothetical protein
LHRRRAPHRAGARMQGHHRTREGLRQRHKPAAATNLQDLMRQQQSTQIDPIKIDDDDLPL